MRRPIAVFIINLEQREVFSYVHGIKNYFLKFFEISGVKGAIPKLTPKRENYNFDKKNAKIDGYGNLLGCYCIKW